MGHKIKNKNRKHPRHGTQCVIQYPTNRNHAQLSGSIGKEVASHAAVARSIPAEVELIYTMHGVRKRYCP